MVFLPEVALICQSIVTQRLRCGTDRLRTNIERANDKMAEQENFPPIRRVVTGHDKNNVAKVIMDGPATNARGGKAGSTSTLIWSTDKTPCEMPIGEDVEDCGARMLGTAPPEHGSRFTVITFPPGNPGRMHRTETVDYVIVMMGELEMDMDDSTVKLKAGDVLVQRGTNHAWVNRGKQVARAAFVLLDAEPLGIGNPVVREQTAS
jgi:quercetin dioxygenase-like cupin family protein